ncbi:MATE family efflux transporter [Phycicoccus sp. SLBN-51]|uniref:MATE family efflux transporter n=1 Tax=Phycicoccus sp. SLBN-51 TaxID=2768447 RepID=UPI001167F03F|nr:MATE family efflux transporter [Phycicoccus sp. SLBN-51]TQJ48802.1 putative MATE family efflux protein [Phycicoccus sp. SLBN-51]
MLTLRPGEESRRILRLAVPAFLALVAEPLFLLADSAIIGHLGTGQLAGLGVASATLLTAANLFVFLAYGTTSIVARQVGAGSERGAVEAGIDGTWLAVALGGVVAVATALAAEPLCRLFGASEDALGYATTYLRISAAGIPAMLVALAATGVLRGLQDTRTPLVASVAGFTSNIVLNLALVYGLGWGIAGSAWGTVIAQTGMATGLVVVLVRHAGRAGAHLSPHPGRVLQAAVTGIPLLVRTLALRAILLVTTWVAAGMGDVPLAAHQVAATVWSFLVFALDALAIAAQALTGKALGAGDVPAARSATSTMVRWGVWGGAVLGALLLSVHTVVPVAFTDDEAVRSALAAALVVVALGQPLSGFVFVVDGVLIGAGDGRWLAKAMVVTLVLYLPIVLGVHASASALLGDGGVTGQARALSVLWVAFTAFMAIRGALFWWRVRGDEWAVTGAAR